MRGRLIYPFVIKLAQLDTTATAADPDGAGELTSGYDEDFREPVTVLANADDQTGESTRTESGPIEFLAQVEPMQFEKLKMMASGVSPTSRFALVAHYEDLENRGLVDATTGKPTIRVNDRLVSIHNCHTGELVEAITDPPGLYVVQVQSRGFGFGRGHNLLLIEFEERAQSVRV